MGVLYNAMCGICLCVYLFVRVFWCVCIDVICVVCISVVYVRQVCVL